MKAMRSIRRRPLAVLAVLVACAALAACAPGRELVRNGEQLIEQGRTAEGLAMLQQAVALEPGNASYRMQLLRLRERELGGVLASADDALRSGQLDDAERLYAQAAALAPASTRLRDGQAALASARRDALRAQSAAAAPLELPPPAAPVLRAALPAGSDVQSRNDTVAVAFRRGARQRVVIVSTAPDADVRDVATALRANVALPTDAYYRIAPGRWLRDGNLTPVDESAVRAAVRGATLAVLHGDTTAMGSPSSLGTRALLLLAPPGSDAPELLVRVAPTSPLQPSLAGIAVESLPPLLAAAPARGGITALSAAPGMSAAGGTPIMTAHEGDVRRVVVARPFPCRRSWCSVPVRPCAGVAARSHGPSCHSCVMAIAPRVATHCASAMPQKSRHRR